MGNQVSPPGRTLIFPGIKDFDPKQTFECGQCFRWNETPGGVFRGVAEGRLAEVSYDRGRKEVRVDELARLDTGPEGLSASEAFWRRYLDLDRDYAKIKRKLSATSALMKDAVTHGGGIRILRQAPWETLNSFIISQNNHIPRIKACIESLCASYGREITPPPPAQPPAAKIARGVSQGAVSTLSPPPPAQPVYTFPDMATMARLGESALDLCRLGYRAPYLLRAAAAVKSDGGAALEAAAEGDAAAAEKYLTSLHGVGPKVAHCVMLYGLGHFDIFPIDTWMKKIMSVLAGVAASDVRAMHEYAKNAYGEYGGIAQQYLFYYIRSGGDIGRFE